MTPVVCASVDARRFQIRNFNKCLCERLYLPVLVSHPNLRTKGLLTVCEEILRCEGFYHIGPGLYSVENKRIHYIIMNPMTILCKHFQHNYGGLRMRQNNTVQSCK